MNLCYLTSSLARGLELHELSAPSPDAFIFVLFSPITHVPQYSGWSIIMSTGPGWEWGIDMSKTAALEEMYLIYQAVRNYLANSEPWGSLGWKTWWRPTAPSASGSRLGGCSWSLYWKS
jgi:hypothetical protein